jgi:hypothetical protein
MTEHPTKQQLDEYSRRVLAPAAFLPVHRHVTTCSVCAEQCSSPAYTARDLAYLREAFIPANDDAPYHLSSMEAVAYAKGTLNEIDAEIAASHLEGCEACAGEVKRNAVSRPARRFGLLPVTAWQPVRVAAAVLFVVVLALLMVWLIRSKPVEQSNDIAGTPQSSPNGSSTPAPSPAEVTAPDTDFALVLEDAGVKVTLDKQGELDGLDSLPVPIQQKLQSVQAMRAAQTSGRS